MRMHLAQHDPDRTTAGQAGIWQDTGLGTKREVWVRAVPEPFYGGLFDRIRDAWSVVRGETFAIYWPKAGELEDALTRNSIRSKK